MTDVIERVSHRAELLQTCVPLLFNHLYDCYQREGLKAEAVTQLGWTHTALLRSVLLQDEVGAEADARQLIDACRSFNVSHEHLAAIQDIWLLDLSKVAARLYGDKAYLVAIDGIGREVARRLGL